MYKGVLNLRSNSTLYVETVWERGKEGWTYQRKNGHQSGYYNGNALPHKSSGRKPWQDILLHQVRNQMTELSLIVGETVEVNTQTIIMFYITVPLLNNIGKHP